MTEIEWSRLNASSASAEKGEKLLAAISADVAEALLNERLWTEPV